MWIHDVYSQKFLGVNSAALKKYGYSREEFMEKTITDIYPALESEKTDIDLTTVGHGRGYHLHRLKSGELVDVEALT